MADAASMSSPATDPDPTSAPPPAAESDVGDRPAELGVEDREQPAGRVFALLLGAHLRAFRRHEPGVRLGEDPEELHQFRVALRRARALLAGGRDVFPEEERGLLEALMARFAELTSEVRDLDVLLESYDDRVAQLSPRLRTGAPELERRLRARSAAARSELIAAMDGDLYPVLLRRWQVLSSVYRIGGGDPGPDAHRRSGDVIDELLARNDRRVRTQAKRARKGHDITEWHSLRKRVKRYRYLVTDVAPLCEKGSPRKVAAALGELQDRLGELQDGVAIAELLEAEGRRGGGSAALTAGAMIEHTVVRTEDDREVALAAWRRFDRPKLRDRRRQLRGLRGG